MRSKIILLLILNISFAAKANYFIEKPDFFDEYQRARVDAEMDKEDMPNMQMLIDRWKKSQPSKLQKLDKPLIPKIIHQIWVGPSSLPEFQQVYIKECRELHPDWEYKFWDDNEVAKLDFGSEELKELYYKSRSYEEQSDVLRAAIMRKYGGIYLDTDVRCLKPYDELLDYYNFATGMELIYKPGFKMRVPILGSAFIAAPPEHPLIQNYVANIIAYWEDGRLLHQRSKEPTLPAMYTAFFQFSRTVLDYLKNNNDERVVMLPSDYFYPVHSEYERDTIKDVNKYSFSVHDYIKKMRFIKFLPLEFAIPEEEQITKHYTIRVKYAKFQEYGYRLNTIAKTLHFVTNNSNDIASSWNNWPYNNWKVEVWNDERLHENLEGKYLELLKRSANRDAFELLSGIVILHKYGGIYINKAAKPGKESLFDLLYTLDFFAGLTNMHSTAPTASDKILGSKPASEISMHILEVLAQHQGQITVSDVQKAIWDMGYEYINIDGRNTFLPQEYFEPVSSQTYSILR